MNFKHALVRKPCAAMVHGISTAGLGLPDYKKALLQHAAYVDALRACGLRVTELPAEEKFPDSVFLEDVAILTPSFALISRPGADSRREEISGMQDVLAPFFDRIEKIHIPGTLEGGDIMEAEGVYYIGLSERTNREGAGQFMAFLEKYGFKGIPVPLKKVLHLKTGLAYLGDNNLLCAGEFIEEPMFNGFNRIVIPDAEAYASNCIRINDKVLVPSGYPLTQEKIESLGYHTVVLDTSEFRKLDGGLSCLSLRF